MDNIIDWICYKLRSEELIRAKKKLKKTDITYVFNTISRICWKNNINYKLLFKNEDILSMRLKGSFESVIIWFHHTNIVKIEDYNRFIIDIENNNSKRGVYITSGSFAEYIQKINNDNRIILEDNGSFLIKQLGLNFNTDDIFKKRYLNFYRYLPN